MAKQHKDTRTTASSRPGWVSAGPRLALARTMPTGGVHGCEMCPSPQGREVGWCQMSGRVRETRSASKGGTRV